MKSLGYSTYKSSKEGYIAFTSLLIISTVTIAVATSVALLGVNELKTSLTHKKGQEAYVIAQSCIEESLQRLKNDSSYNGGSLNVGNGSCTINISGTDPDYVIIANGILTGPPDYSKKINAQVKRAQGTIVITNWQEIY